MKNTANKYFMDNNLMDLRVLSNVGLTDDDVQAVRQLPGVEGVMPSKFVDGLIDINGKPEIDMDGSAFSCRAYSLDMNLVNAMENGANDIQYINRPTLLEGEWPSKPNECLVDESALSTPETFKIGTIITMHGDGEDMEDTLTETEFKIVGIIRTPYYLSFERGNTLVGSGKVGAFMFIPSTTFKTDYYTEMYVKVTGTTDYDFDSFDNDKYEELTKPIIQQIEEISGLHASLRAESLRAETTSKVAQGRIDFAEAQATAEQKLAEARAQLDQAIEFAKTGEQEIADKQAELEASFNDAQRELYSGQSQHSAGVQEYRAKLDAYNTAVAQMTLANNQLGASERELEASKAQLDAAKSEIDKAESKIDNAESQIKTLKTLISTTEEAVNNIAASQDQKMEELRKYYDQFKDSLSPAVRENIEKILNNANGGMQQEAVNELKKQLNQYKEELEVQEQQLSKSKSDLEKAKQTYNENYKKYSEAKYKLDSFKATKDKKEAELQAAYKQLNSAKDELQAAGVNLQVGQLTLTSKQQEARYQIEQAKQKLAEAKQAEKTGEQEYEQKKAEIENELKKAENKIKSGERMLETLDNAQWYVYDRNDTPGYESYGQTADRMKALSQVFPLFFFLVAAMVSLTTMTRMVEEERVQIGTLKALGYDNTAIVSKYLIYATIASVVGSAIGLVIGFTVLPIAIFAAWGIMYELPSVELGFYWSYAFIGILIAVLSTVVAAYFACRKELTAHPATLMRPKAPKAGKRIFLEKISFIWKRLNFTSKVTARNIFRNKRRFFTTVLGIAGCTALMVTGFGLNDSIGAICKKQFEKDPIFRYDAQLILKDPVLTDGSTEAPIITTLKDNSKIDSAMLTYMKVLHAGDVEDEDSQLEANVLVPQSNKGLSQFIDLHNRKSGDPLELTDNGALVTEKLAETANAKVGDEIAIYKNDGSVVNVRVAGIVENYTFHFIYMSQSQYRAAFGEEPQFNSVMATLNEKVKEDAAQGGKQKGQLATELMKLDDINAVVYTTQTMETLDTAINSLTLVIVVFIIAAGALAFVVLYNLSNININERIRELATIKVLGFYDKEVSAYIYRENVFLTLVGTAIGLVLGVLLHKLVAGAIQVDIVMFGKTISALSYVLSALLTIVFSVIVNYIMHLKMKKISMVESLKSVE